MKKYQIKLFAAIMVMITVSSCQEDTYDEISPEKVLVQIYTPSNQEPQIAPGRGVKVSGILAGSVPEDAVVRVSLIDSNGTEVRYAQAEKKGCGNVTNTWYTGPFYQLNPSRTFDEIAYTAPELVVSDISTMAGAKDATIKCVYTDETFSALITSATDVAHGLPIDDYFNLTDHDGNPYTALPSGHYTVKTTVTNSKGQLCGSEETGLDIGIHKKGVIVHENNDLFVPWANENNVAVLIDLLPGMLGPTYNYTCMGLSWSAEYAEYICAPIYIMNYHLYAGGVAQSCEIGNMLQAMGEMDNTARRLIYYYDIGEPKVGNQDGTMVLMDETEHKMEVCRLDEVTADAVNGVYLMDGSQTVSNVLSAADGKWHVKAASTWAVMGVTAPYQLEADEIVESSKYAFINFTNGLTTMLYTIEGPNGTQEVRLPSGIIRRKSGEDTSKKVASYEFYNILPAGIFQAGEEYKVTIQGEDKNGKAINGMTLTLSLVAD